MQRSNKGLAFDGSLELNHDPRHVIHLHRDYLFDNPRPRRPFQDTIYVTLDPRLRSFPLGT